MSTVQRLSAKTTRKLAREINEPTITRAWVDNAVDHHRIEFVTWDHLHGWYAKRSRDWGLYAWCDEPHSVECAPVAPDGDVDPWDDDGRWPILED